MYIKHRLGHETLATNMADVRPLPGVAPYVYHQARPLRKRLRAKMTLVRLLPRVNPLVLHEYRLFRERLSAITATERLVPRVRAQVKLQLLLTRQLLAANVADRAVSRVDVHVQLQAVPVLVLLLADHALVQNREAGHYVLVYRAFVRREVPRVQEIFIAEFALERARAGVVIIVLLEPRENMKALVAGLAEIFGFLVVRYA